MALTLSWPRKRHFYDRPICPFSRPSNTYAPPVFFSMCPLQQVGRRKKGDVYMYACRGVRGRSVCDWSGADQSIGARLKRGGVGEVPKAIAWQKRSRYHKNQARSTWKYHLGVARIGFFGPYHCSSFSSWNLLSLFLGCKRRGLYSFSCIN